MAKKTSNKINLADINEVLHTDMNTQDPHDFEGSKIFADWLWRNEGREVWSDTFTPNQISQSVREYFSVPLYNLILPILQSDGNPSNPLERLFLGFYEKNNPIFRLAMLDPAQKISTQYVEMAKAYQVAAKNNNRVKRFEMVNRFLPFTQLIPSIDFALIRYFDPKDTSTLVHHEKAEELDSLIENHIHDGFVKRYEKTSDIYRSQSFKDYEHLKFVQDIQDEDAKEAAIDYATLAKSKRF